MIDPTDSPELRVLLDAPTRRDGEVTCELLSREGLQCIVCHGAGELADRLQAGAGVLVLTDTTLNDRALPKLSAAMLQQPPWSDVPTVLLTRFKVEVPTAVQALQSFRNVTLLDRPSSTRSMISAVKSALRARQRQYQIRDQLVAQRQAEDALRDADQRKDEFLATLAHELRNPLAAIRTGLDVMLRKPDEHDRAKRIIGMLDRQTRMLIKLIDDLMDVSRIATGKVGLETSTLDLRPVLEASLESARTVFDASHHHFTLDLPDQPVWVSGDASRLAQVVGNLLNNACKYTPDGGRVAVALAEAGGEAVVRVADSGVGIPAELLELVFEMFAQVDRTMDRARGGLGIGLSLVRRLVELHGGSVAAQSPGVGRGSTFVVRLPLVRDTACAGATSTSARDAAAQRCLKILVVDDNRDVAQSLAALLEADGHDVQLAYDGASGIEAAAAFLPEVIFCDIGMPVMSGHELATRLRMNSAHASTLLVAVTGWGADSDRRRSGEAGFDAHFTKPISFEQVRAVLAHV